MFSLRSLVAGAILMAAPVLAAVTPQQIADSLKSITKQARELHAPAQSITNVNAPLIIIRQGPLPVRLFKLILESLNLLTPTKQPLIKGFEEIVSTANALIDQLPNTEPIQKRNVPSRITRRGPDAELVFETFRAVCSSFHDHYSTRFYLLYADFFSACSCSPGPVEYPDWKGWASDEDPLCWPAHCFRSSQG